MGSIVGITDNSWTLVSSYEYDVFWNATLTWTDIWNDRLFTWREYDRETGLYYYRARYYDANLWRFISRDPIGQVDDVNLYGYVGENPINFTDSLGLNSKPAITDTIWNIIDLLTSIDWNQLKNNAGENIRNTWLAISASTLPECLTTSSIAGWCSLALSPTWAWMLSCSPIAVTAWVTCWATALWAWMAWWWNYMMNSSGNWGNNWSNYNYKQDKMLSDGEIKKLKNWWYDIHDLKPDSKYDLFKNKIWDIYFKRKTWRWESEANFIDLNINNF